MISRVCGYEDQIEGQIDMNGKGGSPKLVNISLYVVRWKRILAASHVSISHGSGECQLTLQ